MHAITKIFTQARSQLKTKTEAELDSLLEAEATFMQWKDDPAIMRDIRALKNKKAKIDFILDGDPITDLFAFLIENGILPETVD